MASAVPISGFDVPAQPGTDLLEADTAREDLFNKILDQFADSRLFSDSETSPSIFVVYAHDSAKEGTAYQEQVRTVIRWLKKIHARVLTDQSPLPPLQDRIEGDGAVRNIVSNQLCLLPPRADQFGLPTITSANKVIVCGSEVLERYYQQPYALSYIQDIVHLCTRGTDQSNSILELVIRARVECECNREDFHHIFTELGFLEFRKSVLDEAHAMVPVALNQSDEDEAPMRYLPMFHNTDVKLKLKSREPHSLHKLFFKLLEHLFPRDIDFISPFRDCYDSVISTLKLDSHVSIIRARLDDVTARSITAAHQQYWTISCVVVRDKKLRAYNGKISDRVSKVLHEIESDRRREILNWLSPTSAAEQHGRYLDSGTGRLEGTCDWVIQHEEFRQWYTCQESSFLVLQGNMGTGKTYSTSRVTDWVKFGLSSNDNNEAFAYFYCNKQDPVRRQPKRILRNIIRQLATGPWKSDSRRQTIHDAVLSLWTKRNGAGIHSTFTEWAECLYALINTYPRTTIVLDALDECDSEQRPDLINLLVKLASRNSDAGLVKVFVSTRPQEDVLCHLDKYSAITIQGKHNARDIGAFIRAKIACHPKWSKIAPKFKVELINKLEEKSGEMFLLASLHIQDLLSCQTEPAIRDSLARLPDNLQATYERIHKRATSHDDEKTLLDRALRWVLCSAEPLTTNSLLFAISQESDSEFVRPQRQDLDEDLILRLSENLLFLDRLDKDELEINPGRGFVSDDEHLPVWRLAHQAVAEYLDGGSSSTLGLAHCEAGKVCLMILLNTFGGEFEERQSVPPVHRKAGKAITVCPCMQGKPHVGVDDGLGNLQQKHDEFQTPLTEYAIYAWPTHVRVKEASTVSGGESLSRRLQDFLGKPEKGSISYERWFAHTFGFDELIRSNSSSSPPWSIFATRLMPSVHAVRDSSFAPVSLACSLGIYSTLREWWDSYKLEQNVCFYTEKWTPWKKGWDKRDSACLSWSLVALACAWNEVEILEYLLGREAQGNTEKGYEVPPIVAATISDSEAAVKVLIRHDVDLCSPFTMRYHHILRYAFRFGSLAVIMLLLQVYDHPGKVREAEKALNNCSFQEFVSADILGIIVDMGVNLNTALVDGSLLAAAVNKGFKGLAQTMLSKGADTNQKFGFGGDGLWSSNNALEVVLATYPNTGGKNRQQMPSLLITHGAVVSLKAVALAKLRDWDDETQRLLLRHIADPNEMWQRAYGHHTTPLIESVRDGKVDHAQLLIDRGSDVNISVGDENRDALHVAFVTALSRGGDYPLEPMIEVLCKAGASLERVPKDNHIHIALAAAANAGLKHLVRLFLDCGADPNAVCEHQYAAALGAAAASNSPQAPQIVHTLLKRGGNANKYLPATIGRTSFEYRLALDWPLEKMLYDGRLDIWLDSASVLIFGGAIWDLEFGEWRRCLANIHPDFSQRNIELLDELEQTLVTNRKRFFSTFPEAAFDEIWLIKGILDVNDPELASRSILEEMCHRLESVDTDGA